MVRATRTTRIGTLIGAGLMTATVLTGCGGGGAASGPTTGAGAPSDVAAGASSVMATPAPAARTSIPAGPHNETDISFARSMIPHNVQALASTQIASGKAVKPQVKALAKQIGSTQVSQIEKMSSWLASWGQSVPAGTAGGTAGITQNDLVKLSKTPPGGFDKLWLTEMIAHQQLAVSLAKAEVAKGSSADAKTLAKKILKEQQAQIVTMKSLLKQA